MPKPRIYGDPAGGGGYSPPPPPPPPAPTPDELVRPSTVPIPVYAPAPTYAPPAQQGPVYQPQPQPMDWLGSIFGMIGNPLGNQLAFQNTRPAPIEDDSWMYHGYGKPRGALKSDPNSPYSTGYGQQLDWWER